MPTLCAPRSTRDPCRTTCWFSAAATPWETSWCGFRKGSRPGRPSQRPALLSSSISMAVVYKPHVMGIMVGQQYKILNSDALPHNVHTLPKVNKPFNRAMPATRQGGDHDVRQGRTNLPGQVRCPPLDERLHRRLQLIRFSRRRAPTGSSRSRASIRGPTKSPHGMSGWERRRPQSRSAPTTRRPRTSSSPHPRNSNYIASGEQPHE